MPKVKQLEKSNVIPIDTIDSYFDFVIANALRTSSFPTVVLMRAHGTVEPRISQETSASVHRFLVEQLRDADLLTQLNERTWSFVLMHSSEIEAKGFVSRLRKAWLRSGSFTDQIKFEICITPIKERVTFRQVTESTIDAFIKREGIDEDDGNVFVHKKFYVEQQKTIKISILEPQPMLSRMMENKLQSLNINSDIDVKAFSDGYEFLQSDWYQSSIKHLVIFNEILPRMNGYDVLNYLMRQPNSRKFRTLMLTERVKDEEIIFAYDLGLDDHLRKPFRVELFEAKVKRLIDR